MPGPQVYDEELDADIYDGALYADIQRELKRKNEKERADFMVDLCLLGANSDEKQLHAIDKSRNEYFFPEKRNGELDRELFEERLDLLQRAMIERVLIPQGKFSVEHPQNSKRWVWQQVSSVMPEGSLKAAYDMAFMMPSNHGSNLIERAYGKERPGKSGTKILINLAEEKREQLYRSYAEKSREMEKIIKEGKIYRGDSRTIYRDMTPEEKEQQKQLEQKDSIMGGDEEKLLCTKASYEAFCNLELGYINQKSWDAIQKYAISVRKESFKDKNWEPDDSRNKLKNELTPLADGMAEELKKISGFRLTNSKQFNHLLDDMTKLTSDLRKRDSKRTWSELKQTLEKFREDCKVYQSKTEGKRKTPTGKIRQSMVQDINDLVDYALRKMNEVDKKIPKWMPKWIQDTNMARMKTNITQLDSENKNRKRANTIRKKPENSPNKENNQNKENSKNNEVISRSRSLS